MNDIEFKAVNNILDILVNIINEQATCERSGVQWGTDSMNEVAEIRQQLKGDRE